MLGADVRLLMGSTRSKSMDPPGGKDWLELSSGAERPFCPQGRWTRPGGGVGGGTCLRWWGRIHSMRGLLMVPKTCIEERGGFYILSCFV